MSGIVGMVNLAGAPVDSRLLDDLTAKMDFRGPDARTVWLDDAVGLGHTLLRTSQESETGRQPCTLDGEVLIVADARVDGRTELIAKIRRTGSVVPGTVSDAELILHAYQTWGTECLDHLLGDFAFAIWDGRRRRLFCARDHFGVKPFYYAVAGGQFVFGNTLDCLRSHPGISSELDELAIADFLLFGFRWDASRSSFAQIRKLPAAHSLSVTPDAIETKRYWTLPADECVRYRQPGEYVEHFRDLLQTCVADRLRCDSVGVLMSGGLDSPALAAAAVERSDVQAHTVVYDELIPDEERRYSGLVAGRLGIPIHYTVADGRRLALDGGEGHRAPEPIENPWGSGWTNELRQLSVRHRVAFYGIGPDITLAYEWRPYLRSLATDRKWAELSVHLCRSLGKLPARSLTIARAVLRRVQDNWRPAAPLEFPGWLNPEFENRLHLRERFHAMTEELVGGETPVRPGSTTRPSAHRALSLPPLECQLTAFDADSTGLPLEVRHPYMDVRMVRYLLAVPAIPWCRRKRLLRVAMRDTLPEAVLRRPKPGLLGYPEYESMKRFGRPEYQPAEVLSEYVDRGHRIGQHDDDPAGLMLDLRPAYLSGWLRGLQAETRSRNPGVV